MAPTSLHSTSSRLAGAVLFGSIPSLLLAADLVVVDVFTTSNRPLAMPAPAVLSGIELNVVEVDALARFDEVLSTGLPADPTTAKALVQERLSTLKGEESASLQRAAMGLARVTELGVDRTPAVVFNQHVIIYGVTDVEDALRRYRAWQQTND